nr:DUF4113 domain-containing protein [Atlantibacter hermannii]
MLSRQARQAEECIQQQWQMRWDMLSPRYTTRFADLLIVR